jgi:predicted RecA/RadA family phage recombinase
MRLHVGTAGLGHFVVPKKHVNGARDGKTVSHDGGRVEDATDGKDGGVGNTEGKTEDDGS